MNNDNDSTPVRLVPACKGLKGLWSGHDYQPRYTKGPAIAETGQMTIDPEALAKVLDTYRHITYEGDVCTRCGDVVNAKKATIG